MIWITVRRGSLAAQEGRLRDRVQSSLYVVRPARSGAIYGSKLSIFKPWSLTFPRTARAAPAAVLRQDIADDIRPDASLPAQPAVATLLSPSSICSIYSLGLRGSHRLRLACLAAEESRSTGRAQDAGARDFRAPGPAASLDLRRPRLLRHWACDFGRDPRLGRRLDIMDQRRRRRASDARPRPRAAMARARLDAQRHAHARALSRLRARLLRRPHAQAPRSGAMGAAQGAPLGRSADAAGQLPRPPARFADPRQQSRAVHRRYRRRRLNTRLGERRCHSPCSIRTC